MEGPETRRTRRENMFESMSGPGNGVCQSNTGAKMNILRELCVSVPSVFLPPDPPKRNHPMSGTETD